MDGKNYVNPNPMNKWDDLGGLKTTPYFWFNTHLCFFFLKISTFYGPIQVNQATITGVDFAPYRLFLGPRRNR